MGLRECDNCGVVVCILEHGDQMLTIGSLKATILTTVERLHNNVNELILTGGCQHTLCKYVNVNGKQTSR